MPDQLQLRGGTTTEHNSFTGVSREVTVDTTKKTLVVHDGSTAGGTPLMKESGTLDPTSISIGTGGSQKLGISNSEVVFNETGANVDFRIEGDTDTNLFKVDASVDRIGIGAVPVSTGAKLEVSSSITGGFADASDTILRILNTNNSADTNQTSLEFTTVTTGSGADSAIVSQAENSSGNSRLEFWTDTNNGMTEKMVITSAGNTGINDSSPTAELAVGAVSGNAPHIDIGHTSGNRFKLGYEGNNCFLGATASTGMFIFKQNVDLEGHPQASGSEVLRINNNGNVGISKSIPTEKLDVVGGIQATTNITLASTTSGQSYLVTKDGTQAAKLGHKGTGNEGILVLKDGGTDTVLLQGETGTNSYINSGNVGIGTSSPVGRLHLHKADSGTLDGVMLTNTDTTNNGLTIGINSTEQPFFWNGSNTDMLFATDNGERMRIDTDGRLLVGTTSSTSSDGVISGVRAANTSRIIVGNSNVTASGICGYDMLPSNKVTGARIECRATEDFSTTANRTADLGLFTRKDGTLAEKLTILSNGNVGIGTTSPNSLLNIHGVFETNAYDSSNAQGGIYTAKGFLIGDAYAAGKGSKTGVGDDRNMCLWQERGLNVHFGVSDELAATIDVQKRFLIGNYGASLPVWGVHGALQLTGTTWDQTSIILNNFGNNTNRGTLQFMKSKSGTLGNYATAVGANEVIGQINWSAADTADATNLAAQIEVTSFGAPTNNNQYGRFQFKTQNGAGSTNATRVIIDNDGLKFDGNTGADNALNDYEEGSFTPTLTTQSSALTAGYTSQDGKYTKIGNFVHFQIYIRLSSKSGGSGQLRINGLPFTSSAASGSAYGGAVVAYTYNWDNDALDRMMIGSGSTQVQLFVGQSGGTNTDAGAGNLNSDTQIRIFGSYRV